MTDVINRAALLVDGDNIPPALVGAAVVAATGLGTLAVRRVHVHPQHLPAWAAVTGFRVVTSAAGKNATDMALAIDAVDLAAREGFAHFALASSDRDFSALAHYLRERGCRVLGIGEGKTPKTFRDACSRFQEIGRPKRPASKLSETDQHLRALITSANGSGLAVGVAGGLLFKHHGTKATELPGGSLRAYMRDHSSLYELDPKGPDAKVRWVGPQA
ncbi:MAG: NYN domain-containing protein [Rubellimicrobium sp.]|nr:NYN domain-containing protein [Rubellimicrobium sp.]